MPIPQAPRPTARCAAGTTRPRTERRGRKRRRRATLGKRVLELGLQVVPGAFQLFLGFGVALLALHSAQQLIIHREFDPVALLDAVERYRLQRLFLQVVL